MAAIEVDDEAYNNIVRIANETKKSFKEVASIICKSVQTVDVEHIVSFSIPEKKPEEKGAQGPRAPMRRRFGLLRNL